jgi:hypothetical protein
MRWPAFAAVLIASAWAARAHAAEPAPAPASAPPDAPERCRILVLELQGRALPEADAELPALLTETMAAELGSLMACEVITEAEVKTMLNVERAKAVCARDSDSCLAEIGEAYGAERVVAGSFGHVDASYVLTARLMNVRRGMVERRSEETVSDARGSVMRAAKNAGRRLAGVAPLADAPVEAGPSSWLIGGAVVAGIGAVAALGGGAITALAEVGLADRDNTDKDGTLAMGRGALVVASVGLVAGLVGGGVAVASWE